MNLKDTSILKGIHPGVILDRELKARNLTKGRFALSINEYPTLLGDITNGRRKMNPDLAIRIEEALGIEEGFFMILQAFYDIKQAKRRNQKKPELSRFRKSLFWDTDINNIDWLVQKPSIIHRVFERGNDSEKAEIIRFYGQDQVDAVLSEARTTKPHAI